MASYILIENLRTGVLLFSRHAVGNPKFLDEKNLNSYVYPLKTIVIVIPKTHKPSQVSNRYPR
jgi:hypothetical protein